MLHSHKHTTCPILSQINPVHITQCYIFAVQFNRLCLYLPSDLNPSGFPNITPYAFLFPPPPNACDINAHFVSLKLITPIYDGEYKLYSSSLCNFSPFSSYFLPLRLKCLPQHPILGHPQPIFFPSYDSPSSERFLMKMSLGSTKQITSSTRMILKTKCTYVKIKLHAGSRKETDQLANIKIRQWRRSLVTLGIHSPRTRFNVTFPFFGLPSGSTPKL